MKDAQQITKKSGTEKTAYESSYHLVKRLVATYLRPQTGIVVFALALMFVSSAMTGLMAKMMEPIIDKVFANPEGGMLWIMAGVAFAVFALRGISTYGHNVLLFKVGEGIVAQMQRDMFGHLVYADQAYFHGQNSGQLMSRFISDMGMVRVAVREALTGIGKNFFTLIFLLAVMFYQDFKLASISLFVFPAAAYAVVLMGKKLRRVSTHAQVETGILAGMLGQAFQGSKHIKAYAAEEFEKERVGKVIHQVYKLANRQFRTSALTTPVAEVLSGLAIVTIIVYGGGQVVAGESTAGKLFSFITAFLLAYEPMKRMAKMNATLQMGLAALDRMFKMIDTPPDIAEKPDARALSAKTPDIVFDRVSFRYADGTEALRDVSFTAPAGKTVALVGESGAGKSTILNLLPRFYDIDGGAIKIDGQDIRDVTLQSLRSHLALVSQEIAIFNDTIRDNIAYGKKDVSDADIVAVAKAAAAHDFIMELPEGYDTVVGENGVKLSGGQRQRISIARAMMKDAPVLLLDEATSALDTQSERLVQDALTRLQKGRTTIVVAHRLSTIMNADNIYVLKNGRVAESGTHDELLGAGGIYARLHGTLLQKEA